MPWDCKPSQKWRILFAADALCVLDTNAEE